MASMTINYARESVIDFTKPFMNLGIGILFKVCVKDKYRFESRIICLSSIQVPTSQPTRLFSFMNPLAVEIWLYVLAAYMLVSFTLFVMARFSPYEWNNPHPCHQESDIVENQFSVSNSFWFITGTFLRQGSGLNPKVDTTLLLFISNISFLHVFLMNEILTAGFIREHDLCDSVRLINFKPGLKMRYVQNIESFCTESNNPGVERPESVSLPFHPSPITYR